MKKLVRQNETFGRGGQREAQSVEIGEEVRFGFWVDKKNLRSGVESGSQFDTAEAQLLVDDLVPPTLELALGVSTTKLLSAMHPVVRLIYHSLLERCAVAGKIPGRHLFLN